MKMTSTSKIKNVNSFNAGVLTYSKGNYNDSKMHLIRFIEKNAQHIQALELLGSIATIQERPDEAYTYFAEIVQIDDTKASHFYNLGHSLQQLNQNEQALTCYDQAISLKQDFANPHSNKASIFLKQYDLQKALDSYQRAIELDQNRFDDYISYALVLLELNLPDQALEVCEIAAELGASQHKMLSNKGFILSRVGRDAEAEQAYLKALELEPTDPNTRWNLSHLYLRHGIYSKGWQLYEARWDNKNTKLTQRIYAQPLWLGQASIEGKTIFLHPEQGLGDIIQFCRYAQHVAALGARVILEVPVPLKALLVGLKGVHILISDGDIIPFFDFHCPLMSLPLSLGLNEKNLPSTETYIKSNPQKVAEWREKLKHTTRPKVGLVWSGGFHAAHLSQRGINHRRNLSINKLSVFKGLKIDFYSLQKGNPAESELKQQQANHWNGLDIINYADYLTDFSDTAALIENLDLVITVDTATAHLAGAMGKSVWLLNRFDSCWRWGVEGTQTHWYPNMKIFRQTQAHNWDEVLNAVVSELCLLK